MPLIGIYTQMKFKGRFVITQTYNHFNIYRKPPGRPIKRSSQTILTLNSHNIPTQASYISTFLDKLYKRRKKGIRTIVRSELHFVLFQLHFSRLYDRKR